MLAGVRTRVPFPSVGAGFPVLPFLRRTSPRAPMRSAAGASRVERLHRSRVSTPVVARTSPSPGRRSASRTLRISGPLIGGCPALPREVGFAAPVFSPDRRGAPRTLRVSGPLVGARPSLPREARVRTRNPFPSAGTNFPVLPFLRRTLPPAPMRSVLGTSRVEKLYRALFIFIGKGN